MAGEGDKQINGTVGPSIPEVMEGAAADAVATNPLATVWAGPRRPVATAPFDARFGGRFSTRVMPSVTSGTYSFGPDIGCSPDTKGVRSSSYAKGKAERLHQLC